jgi:vancomycin resistance protein VanJ
MTKWIRRFWVALAVFYGAAFVAWQLLLLSPLHDRWWQLQVSEIFTLWFFVPLPLLLLAGLVWRSRWLWMGILIPLIWFGINYGGLFLPTVSAVVRASAVETPLRVMTINSWYKEDRDDDFAKTVEVWLPDVIAVQEVSPRFKDKLEMLALTWPYQVYQPSRGKGGGAILSKFPILSQKMDKEGLGCRCMQAVIDWHGETIRVISVHVHSPRIRMSRILKAIPWVRSFDASEQSGTYAALLQEIEGSQEPVIVLGDFNTTEQQPGYRLLYASGLKDAHAEAGWGFGLTYPSPGRFPGLNVSVIRIDHIFYDSYWRATRTWTSPLMHSDHQALVADLRLAGH